MKTVKLVQKQIKLSAIKMSAAFQRQFTSCAI